MVIIGAYVVEYVYITGQSFQSYIYKTQDYDKTHNF